MNQMTIFEAINQSKKKEKLLTDEDMETVINDIQRTIYRKWSMHPLNRQDLDGEIMAWISVYRHGGKLYKEQARKVLCKFASNAGIIKSPSKVS